VAPGGSVGLAALAADPDLQDLLRLRYQWTAPAGSFSAPTSPLTRWTAPPAEADVTLTLTVRDPRGASTSVSLVVRVRRPPGKAQVTAVVNHGPHVTGMTAADAQLDLGQATLLTAAGFDPDREPTAWNWTSSCAGGFAAASSPSTTFTPRAPYPPGGTCTLLATARDGRGGVGEGRLGIAVTPGPVPAYAPVFGATWQDAELAAPGELLAFEAAASAPSGLPVAIFWSASAGTLAPAAPSPGFDAAVRWTAACATGGFATVVATATDGAASALRGFVVSVPPCR
jgi:hypothetical protein